MGLPGVRQDRNLHQQNGMSMWCELFRAKARHTLNVWMLVCTHGVRRKVTKTLPMAQQPPPGQMSGFDLLGVHR